MRITNIILWFVLGLVVFTVLRIPAAFVLQFLPLNDIAYQKVSGSIWNGEFEVVQFQEHSFEKVKWQFQPIKLLTGNAVVDLRFGDARQKQQYSGRATFSYGISGKRVENAQVRVMADDLKFLSPIPLGDVNGRVVVDIKQYQFGLPLCDKLDGAVTWLDAGVDINGVIDFGMLPVTLSCEDNKIAASMDGNNSLGLSGKAMLLSTSDFSFEGVAKPSNDLPAVIHQSLGFVGKKRKDGGFDIKL